MVYLYSGTPGSGKSLHAAGDIYEAARYGSKKLIITNFAINTDNIKKQKNEILVIPNWEITVERIQQECRKFFATYYKGKIKEGKILIFLDEAGQLFNSRDYRIAGRRDWCTFVSEHRKYGCNIYLICQFDRQLDRQIRSCIQYNLEHRKMANFGKGGKLLSLLFFGHQFAYFIADYPTGERIGKKFCKSKRRYRQIYDTFEVFSDSGKKDEDKPEQENEHDNNDNETNEQANLVDTAGNKLAKVQIWEKVTKTIWKGINMVRETNAEIFREMSKEDKINWFDLKEKKFLHQIDTFYYTVKLKNDFTADSEDAACHEFRKYLQMQHNKCSFGDYINIFIPDYDGTLNYRPFSYGLFYDHDFECPDMFDIMVAETVPVGEDGCTSVTPEFIVQIRSEYLWQMGYTKAFEGSYEAVKVICKHFNLEIAQVMENRVDYCWHTNYLQNPEKFFSIDRFAKMQVSHFKGVSYHYTFTQDDAYENDYVALGKRNDKCFVRIYLKSKEVVEKGYKGWFFKEWLFNGLINRYDYYVYEKCYLQHNWKYIDTARLEWYLEYGKKEYYKKDIRAILDGVVTAAPETIAKLADRLTPKVTIIMNVEFQTMRKQSKSYCLFELKEASDKSAKRIYELIHNRPLITEYLTNSVLRLVDRKTDTNKSRCEMCAFWKALRSTKFVDAKKLPDELKLVRDYSRNLNSQAVKRRIMSSSVTLSLYLNGINDYGCFDDVVDALCTLNDNDIDYMKKMKEKRKGKLNKLLYETALEDKPERKYCVLDKSTGEFI